jgi:hypothetical protein
MRSRGGDNLVCDRYSETICDTRPEHHTETGKTGGSSIDGLRHERPIEYKKNRDLQVWNQTSFDNRYLWG